MGTIKTLRSIAVLIIGITSLATSCPRGTAFAAAADEPLIQQGDLVYQGAFRVPAGDGVGCDGNTGQHCFMYGGNALAYNPARHSLFFGGHDWVQTLGEVSIPATINLSSTATVLQNLTDVTEGKLGTLGPSTNKLAGTMVYNNRLIVTGSIYYGPSGNQS